MIHMGHEDKATLRCMLSEKAYSKKPQGPEVGAMRRAFRVFDGTIHDLAYAVGSGHAFMCCEAAGGVDAGSWRGQQLFALDFDQKGEPVALSDVLERMECYGLAPAFAYETYSSTEQCRRFRVVLASDERFDDAEAAASATGALLELFPEADQACSDLARMFYGTDKRAVWIAGNSVPKATLDAIGRAYAGRRAREAAAGRGGFRRNRPTGGFDVGSSADLDELKRDADLLGMAAAATDLAPRESGGIVYFHGRCPVCGHRDCFRFYPAGNRWKCFSESNRGIDHGSVIDYVMAVEGLPETSAGVARAIAVLRG